MTKPSDNVLPMMDPERSELLDVLRAGPVGVSSAEEVELARERMLPWLEEQVSQLPLEHARRRRQKSRVRALQRSGGALAAAAALALAWLATDQLRDSWQETHDSALATQSSAPDASRLPPEQFFTLVSGKVQSGSLDVLAGSRLGPTSRITTGATEGAALIANSGYQLEIGPGSDISFAPPRTIGTGKASFLHLHSGSAKLSVLPLPPGSTLGVVTHDARVTVVGTAFSVETRKDEVTCVRVTEGKVLVERAGESKLLRAGEESGCEGKRTESTARTAPQHTKTSSAKGTTLAEENKLLSLALAAERKGQVEAARRAYQQLLQRYPGSPLTEDARAGLSRVSGAKRPSGLRQD
jgi:hypothetical protein